MDAVIRSAAHPEPARCGHAATTAMRRTLLIRHHAERWHHHRRGLHQGSIARAHETYLVGCVDVVQQACAATGMPRLAKAHNLVEARDIRGRGSANARVGGADGIKLELKRVETLPLLPAHIALAGAGGRPPEPLERRPLSAQPSHEAIQHRRGCLSDVGRALGGVVVEREARRYARGERHSDCRARHGRASYCQMLWMTWREDAQTATFSSVI